jgi:predicted unusual protein kinase regulating ubiquinone biosynthesis (AarF/ABC1/UbiB family)
LASKVARNAIKTATHANTTLVKRVSAQIKHIEQDAQTAVEKVAEEEKWLATSEAKGKVTPLGELQARHVVKTGKETYLQMLLVDNFIHADMHPGNIIVRLTPGEKLPTLVLIDAGMVDVMGPHEQDNFIGLFKAMGSGKGDVAAKYLLNFSARQDAADVEGFTREITTLFETKCRGFGTGVDVGEVLQGVLDALRKVTTAMR